jgi:WD40 repeat protein
MPGRHHLWDAVTGKELPLADELKRYFVFVADGKLLAAITQPGGRIVDLLTGKEVPADGIDAVAESNKAYGNGLSKPAHSPDGKLYATRDGKRIRVFDAATHKELPALADQPDAGPQSITFSPDGKRLRASGEPVRECVWDLTTQLIARLPAQGSCVEHTAFSADGRTLAGSDGPSVTLWDVASGNGCTTSATPPPSAPSPSLPTARRSSPVARTPTASSASGIRSPARSGRWLGHQVGVVGLAFLPDGRTVVSASQDESVRLWDSTTGKEIRRLAQTPESLWALAVAPDGKTLATGGAATVRLWDVATGEELCTFGDKRDAVGILSRQQADGHDRPGRPGRRGATPPPAGSSPAHRPRTDPLGPIFSPTGLSCRGDSDGPIHLWEVATGRERVIGETLKADADVARSAAIAFSPEAARWRRVTRTAVSGCGRSRRAANAPGSPGTPEYRDRARLLARWFAAGLRSADRTAIVWDVTGRHTAGVARGTNREGTARPVERLADADAASVPGRGHWPTPASRPPVPEGAPASRGDGRRKGGGTTAEGTGQRRLHDP